jgi:hypothetical protein
LALTVRPKASSDEDSTGFQAEELLDDLKSKVFNEKGLLLHGFSLHRFDSRLKYF